MFVNCKENYNKIWFYLWIYLFVDLILFDFVGGGYLFIVIIMFIDLLYFVLYI